MFGNVVVMSTGEKLLHAVRRAMIVCVTCFQQHRTKVTNLQYSEEGNKRQSGSVLAAPFAITAHSTTHNILMLDVP
jgi:hypothetical protein